MRPSSGWTPPLQRKITKEARCRSIEGPYGAPARGPTSAQVTASRPKAWQMHNGFFIEARPERGKWRSASQRPIAQWSE
jgi:hypothetical protein